MSSIFTGCYTYVEADKLCKWFGEICRFKTRKIQQPLREQLVLLTVEVYKTFLLIQFFNKIRHLQLSLFLLLMRISFQTSCFDSVQCYWLYLFFSLLVRHAIHFCSCFCWKSSNDVILLFGKAFNFWFYTCNLETKEAKWIQWSIIIFEIYRIYSTLVSRP